MPEPDDIVERLRAFDSGAEPTYAPQGLLGEAADTIERLRKLLAIASEFMKP